MQFYHTITSFRFFFLQNLRKNSSSNLQKLKLLLLLLQNRSKPNNYNKNKYKVLKQMRKITKHIQVQQKMGFHKIQIFQKNVSEVSQTNLRVFKKCVFVFVDQVFKWLMADELAKFHQDVGQVIQWIKFWVFVYQIVKVVTDLMHGIVDQTLKTKTKTKN